MQTVPPVRPSADADAEAAIGGAAPPPIAWRPISRQAAAWLEPLARLSLPPARPTAAGAASRQAPTTDAPDSPATDAMTTAVVVLIGPLAAALARVDVPAVRDLTRRLAGLGPGSTPAGDDVLVGAVLATHAAHGGEPPAPCLGAAIANAAHGRTSARSWAWIAAAARGEAIAPWHQLIATLAAAEASAPDRSTAALAHATAAIGALGATSGRFALSGFAATLEACAATEASATSYPPRIDSCRRPK